MPALGMLLYNIVAGLTGILLKYLSQKVAVSIALIALFSGVSAAVYIAMRSAISAAVSFSASYHPMFGAGVAVVISPHTASLVTSYVAVWTLLELYKWKMNIMFLWYKF